MESDFIFTRLPTDIINNILNYTGKIYYYKGKYIGKIDKNNDKYNSLMRVPKPVKISRNKYNLYLINKNTSLGYILQYDIDFIKKTIILQLMFKKGCSFMGDLRTIEWYIMPSNIYSKWRRVTSYTILEI
jgi:hypothetical protein